jgi:hypothetical protein
MPTILQRLKNALKYNPLKGVSKKANNIMHSVFPSKRKRSTIRKSGAPASKRAKTNFPPANVAPPAPAAPPAPVAPAAPAAVPSPAPVAPAVGGKKMRMKNLKSMAFYKARNIFGSRKGRKGRKASRKGRKGSRRAGRR